MNSFEAVVYLKEKAGQTYYVIHNKVIHYQKIIK